MKNFLNIEDEKRIVEMRKEGISPKTTMNLFHIKKHHYYNIINRNGEKRKVPNKKYTQNDNYFSKIDTPDKAYWLGFIFADGYIRKYHLSIGLASKDKEHLFRFLTDMGSDSKIKDKVIKKEYKGVVKEYFSSTIDVYSIPIYDDLLKYGLHTKKSLTLLPPENISSEYYRDFIRGYFDGDGCITNYKLCGKNHKKIKILGTYLFLEWINFILSENKVSKRKIDKQTNKIFRLQYNTKDSDAIFEFLYRNASTYLQRKKEKFI